MDEPDPPVAKGLDHLLGLVLAQQAVVDEHAGELIADRAVDERRGGRGVDASREPADHSSLADLGAHRRDLLVDHRGGRPALLEARDLAQEAVEDLGAVRRVDDLGVELDPVQAPLGALAGGDRRPWAGGQRDEARRRLEDAVAVAHPALLLARQPGQQLPAAVGEDQRGAPELARVGAFDPAAEDMDHRLHPVADAQHRDVELEQLAAQLRRARPSRPTPARRRAPARRDAARGSAPGRCRGGAARRTPRTRGSAGRSAGSTARRSRGPVLPRRPAAVSHPRRRPLSRPRRARSSPCPPTARAVAACPRSAGPGRPSPRRAGSRGCPRSRRWPSRCAARRSG